MMASVNQSEADPLGSTQRAQKRVRDRAGLLG